jgi:hypothetical protein
MSVPQPSDVPTPYMVNETREVEGVAIQPAVITEVKNVSSFRVMVVSLELFKSVTVVAILQDANGNQLASRTFTFADAEYLAWNNDDQYLIGKVAERLGFTLA